MTADERAASLGIVCACNPHSCCSCTDAIASAIRTAEAEARADAYNNAIATIDAWPGIDADDKRLLIANFRRQISRKNGE